MAVTPKKVKKGGFVQGGEHTLHTVDATGRSLGRVASEVASILLGKKSVHYVQNEILPIDVKVVNASKLKMTEKRIAMKEYAHYTGYPGGLRTTPMARVIEREGIRAVLLKTIDGMIPRNKLRRERMKRVTITD